ncbi:MAG TPA: hypothetical protein VFQ35_07745 [Polyangiaceae bacterium]|nr:hypothetical protein [Polyangiaceae bacterium]
MGATVLRAALATIGMAVSACSASTSSYTSDAERGSTHALITVERRDTLSSAAVSDARAFATFVRTPPEVDIATVTRLAGLDLTLPEPGDCALGGTHKEVASLSSPLRRVELMAAGDVALETPASRVELAPRAFPAVTDLFAGVVYTTRDRAALLPTGEVYAVTTAGSSSLAPLSVSTEAPQGLSSLTLSGQPLSSTSILPASGAELGWRAGSARDLVYVALSTSDGTPYAVCAFRDDAGRGIIPASAVPASSSVSLAVHRLRSVTLPASTGGIDAGELRFDFEQSTSVSVQGR